jgi:hypothetical protein
MKKQSDRCQKFIGGQQCDNYRLQDANRCAVHAKPKDKRAKG